MKQNIVNDSVSTITSGNVVGMTMDQDSIQHILHVLTDMYPDTDMAVIREYATNALDSHIDSGQKRPIEITLPSRTNPFYLVQDWGLGMGHYELNEIYGVYGRSTKRKSNDALGSFGLGSKSALASIDAFQLTAIKDGKKFNVLIDKDAHGVGQLRIMPNRNAPMIPVLDEDGQPVLDDAGEAVMEQADYVETDEHNGVTVKIPVSIDKVDSFAEKAEQLFMLWEEGTVLVNGQPPKSLRDYGYHKVDGVGYISYEGYKSIRVSMGGLVYKIDGLDYRKETELYRDSSPLRNKDVIIEAGIGDVSISPARESILSNSDNLRFVRNKLTAMYEYLQANARKDINAASDPIEAMQLIETFGFLRMDNPTYNGVEYKKDYRVAMDNYYWSDASARRKKMNASTRDTSFVVSSKPNKCLIINTGGNTTDADEFLKYLNQSRGLVGKEFESGRVYVGDFTTLQDDIFVKALIERGDFTVAQSDDLKEKVIAERKSNRTPRAARAARGAVTYSVYKAGGTVSEMTLAEIRNLNSGYYHHMGQHDNPFTVQSAFEEFIGNDEHLVIVPQSRKIDALLARVKDDVELVYAQPVMIKKLRDQLKAVFETQADEKVYKFLTAGNYDTRKFFELLGPVKDKLKSEKLKALIGFDTEKFDAVRLHNDSIFTRMRGLNDPASYEERVKFLYPSGDSSMTDEFMDYYRFAINGTSASTVDRAVLFLNALHDAEGEPTFW